MSNKRKNIFNGKLLKVFTVERQLPNGRKAYFEEVKHPGAVLVVPFINNKIVFLRQFRPVINQYIWELPAGKLDPGERPFTCVKREMLEETGFTLRNIKRIGRIFTTPGFSDEIIYIYRADCAEKQKARPEEDELIRVKILDVSRIRTLFSRGKINDAKTIAGLSFARVL